MKSAFCANSAFKILIVPQILDNFALTCIRVSVRFSNSEEKLSYLYELFPSQLFGRCTRKNKSFFPSYFSPISHLLSKFGQNLIKLLKYVNILVSAAILGLHHNTMRIPKQVSPFQDLSLEGVADITISLLCTRIYKFNLKQTIKTDYLL